jgi:uncharacterized protein (DUF433 family)
VACASASRTSATLLAAGVSRNEIFNDYPLLEAVDVTAALEYAARQNQLLVRMA